MNEIQEAKDEYFFRNNLGKIRQIVSDVQEHKKEKIAILGASVSKGEIVPKGTDFFSVLRRRWQEYFQMDFSPEFINASKSGTLSGNGMFSMWELLEEKPDLVFLDYSVNDPGDSYLKETFEGMLYQFLNHGCFVVVLLFCNSRGNCTRGAMSRIARHYGVPLLDVGRIVMEQIENGVFTWDQFASDYVHPTVWGHEYIAELLLQFFEETLKSQEKECFQISETPCFDGVFRELEIVDAAEWDEESFVWEGVFSTLVVEYTQSQGESKCVVDIYIDGNCIRTIEKQAEFSWDNRVVNLIMEDEKNSSHSVELRLAKNAAVSKDELMEFHIKLGVGVMPAN